MLYSSPDPCQTRELLRRGLHALHVFSSLKIGTRMSLTN